MPSPTTTTTTRYLCDAKHTKRVFYDKSAASTFSSSSSSSSSICSCFTSSHFLLNQPSTISISNGISAAHTTIPNQPP